MVRLAVLVCALALSVGVVWHFGGPRGPTLAEVQHLLAPRLVEKQPRRMMVVRGTASNAQQVAAAALSHLFRVFFKLVDGSPGAPSGRWWNLTDGYIRGEIGLEVPLTFDADASALPEGVEIVTWEYSARVAEVLHVGSYATETPTVDRLRAFAAENGAKFTDSHEEEYLRGPGMLFAGNPDTYLTLIRSSTETSST
jgi:hypothetical protein